jgi:hypothetical protein
VKIFFIFSDMSDEFIVLNVMVKSASFRLMHHLEAMRVGYILAALQAGLKW